MTLEEKDFKFGFGNIKPVINAASPSLLDDEWDTDGSIEIIIPEDGSKNFNPLGLNFQGHLR